VPQSLASGPENAGTPTINSHFMLRSADVGARVHPLQDNEDDEIDNILHDNSRLARKKKLMV
jgi:hypothetical protein